jgi:hypothetical protein
MAPPAQPLWAFFHRGEKQNATHYHTYCKACVAHFELMSIGDDDQDDASEYIAQKERFTNGKQLK